MQKGNDAFYNTREADNDVVNKILIDHSNRALLLLHQLAIDMVEMTVNRKPDHLLETCFDVIVLIPLHHVLFSGIEKQRPAKLAEWSYIMDFI